MDKKQLYESIIKSVAKTVKQAINEAVVDPKVLEEKRKTLVKKVLDNIIKDIKHNKTHLQNISCDAFEERVKTACTKSLPYEKLFSPNMLSILSYVEIVYKENRSFYNGKKFNISFNEGSKYVLNPNWPNSGSHYVQRECTTSMCIYETPCDEFKQVRSILSEKDNYPGSEPIIKPDYVYTGYAWGKRDYMSVSDAAYLAYDKKACKDLLKFIQKNITKRYRYTISFGQDTDYGDRYNSHGEDRESEWYGHTVGTVNFYDTDTRKRQVWYYRPSK